MSFGGVLDEQLHQNYNLCSMSNQLHTVRCFNIWKFKNIHLHSISLGLELLFGQITTLEDVILG